MKRLFGLSETTAAICAALGFLFLLLLACGLLVIMLIYPFERPLPYSVGLLLGCASSALKIVLIEKSMSRSIDMEKKTAQNYASLQVILRYMLTIVVFLGVIFLPDIVGLFGTILGVLSLQVAAYIASVTIKKRFDSERK